MLKIILQKNKFIKHLLQEPFLWLEEVIRNIPGSIGMFARRLWMRKQLSHLGHSANFSIGAVITRGGGISVGNNYSQMRNTSLYAFNGSIKIGHRVSVNSRVCIDASENGLIIIGNDVLIGPNVVIRASNHCYTNRDIPINQQGHSGGKIIIDDDVWIGANAVILPGVTIGCHAIIAAGAVVTRDLKPYEIVGGIPARRIATR